MFAAVPEGETTDSAVLEWCRIRWQVELVVQFLKSLAQLGSLRRHHPGSANPWLYGKLLVEQLISVAGSILP